MSNIHETSGISQDGNLALWNSLQHYLSISFIHSFTHLFIDVKWHCGCFIVVVQIETNKLYSRILFGITCMRCLPLLCLCFLLLFWNSSTLLNAPQMLSLLFFFLTLIWCFATLKIRKHKLTNKRREIKQQIKAFWRGFI